MHSLDVRQSMHCQYQLGSQLGAILQERWGSPRIRAKPSYHSCVRAPRRSYVVATLVLAWILILGVGLLHLATATSFAKPAVEVSSADAERLAAEDADNTLPDDWSPNGRPQRLRESQIASSHLSRGGLCRLWSALRVRAVCGTAYVWVVELTSSSGCSLTEFVDDTGRVIGRDGPACLRGL